MSTTTDVLQATGAIAQSLFAAAGLYGLFKYTRETTKMREAMLEQNRLAAAQHKASMRPFLRFRVESAGPNAEFVAILVNEGPGHAIGLDVELKDGSVRSRSIEENTLAVDGELAVAKFPYTREASLSLHAVGGIKVKYTDLAGNPYWSLLKASTTTDGHCTGTFVSLTGEGFSE